MIETALRRFVEHPARHWAIIILILGIGFTVVLPIADEHSNSRQDRAHLEELVAKMRREVADLEEVRRKANEKRERLSELEALAVAADQVPLFRQEVVDWARKSGCQVRRIRLEPPKSQRWQKGDTLSESTAAKRKRVDSPYVLQTQPLSVSVSGTLSKVKSLLSELHSSDRLIQCGNLLVNPSRDNRKEVVLNVELMLFDLTRAETPPGR